MQWIRAYLAALLVTASCQTVAQSDHGPWLMVDTSEQTLTVMEEGRVKYTFKNISLGRNGYDPQRTAGDGRTPLGVFRVAWINPNSRFHLFFGLDYPNHQRAEQAFQQKLIDFDTYFSIRRALYRGDVPPQNTPLGGNIGIHGIGNGNRRVHEQANWTEGCIALTNEQVDKLAQWVSLGTRVVIY